ncbi:MAG: class I SAM-dependent methyltransferase [Candidatus Omnitrophota bacterium]|nr:class I SAM-dependent methyltransferase [Candidatus Omnitrophota bacterium]
MKLKKITNSPRVLLGMFFTRLGHFVYSYASRLDKDAEAIFLNYGYADANLKLELRKEDAKNRYCIQLYNHIVASLPVELKGLDVLEVGSGRGGGASYVARYFNPGSITGLDLCRKAVTFCTEHYAIKGMSFVCGNALNLPFQNNSLDVVIGVESSHGYPKIKRFFSEVDRVLKPGGYFLLSDFRNKNSLDLLREQLRGSGLKTVKEEIITPNIIKALDLDSERRENLIKKLVPKVLHKPSMALAGVKGTAVYKSFVTGKKEYLVFVLQKPLLR